MDTPDLHQHFTKNSLMLPSLVLSWCGCGLTQACLVRGDVTAALHVLCVYDDFIVVLSFEQHKSVLHEYCRSTAGVLQEYWVLSYLPHGFDALLEQVEVAVPAQVAWPHQMTVKPPELLHLNTHYWLSERSIAQTY